ncbi:hypothetical protein OROGR_018691 [Orobanche gracilis]
MESLPLDESVPADITSKSDDPNSKQMKQINGGSSSPSSPATNTDVVNISVNKANYCKGCLYYSSRLKAGSKNPVCVGLTGSLPSVLAPRYSVGELEMEAHKAGRSLKDFRYGCVGYSVYVNVKEQGRVEQTKLPLCVGFEVLGDRVVDNREDGNGSPQHKPANSTGEKYLSRFTRNADVVAKGVAKNMRRVGNQIKDGLEDVLFPYTKRPK